MKENFEMETIFKKRVHEKFRFLGVIMARSILTKFWEVFFLETGIVHLSSCNNTPQQNGLDERKNKYLLEVAQTLLFTTMVPKYL